MNQILRYCKELLKFPHANDFAEDFRDVFKIFYFTGFYRLKNSRKSFITSLIGLTLVFVPYLCGCVKDSMVVFYEGNVNGSLINSVLISMVVSFCTQMVTFVANQTKIVELAKVLQKLHDNADNEEMEHYKKNLLQLQNIVKTAFKVLVTFLMLLKVFGLSFAKLILPALYDIFATGNLNGILLIINVIHVWDLAFSYAACEVLHIVFMVRIEANLKFLANKLRFCGDDINPELNEAALCSCIKYHCSIIE